MCPHTLTVLFSEGGVDGRPEGGSKTSSVVAPAEGGENGEGEASPVFHYRVLVRGEGVVYRVDEPLPRQIDFGVLELGERHSQEFTGRQVVEDRRALVSGRLIAPPPPPPCSFQW